MALLRTLQRTPASSPLPMACTNMGLTIGALPWEELEVQTTGEAWRGTRGLRADLRCLQVCLLDELTKLGFTIKAPKEKNVLEQFEDLKTVPAHPAYDLKAELQG